MAQPVLRAADGSNSTGRLPDLYGAAENPFRHLIEGAAIGVVVVAEGRIAYANAGASQLFGYSSALEMVALDHYSVLLAEHERPAVQRIMATLLAGRKVQCSYETAGLRRDGTTVKLEIRPSVTRWTGRPAACAVICEAPTRKNAWALAASEVANLAHVDRINTLGQMAATIMHEIAQPLTALSFAGGALRRLLSQPSPPLDSARQASDTITKEAERMRDTIDRIKQFSSGRGRREQQLVPVDIETAVEHALMLTAPAYRAAGVACASLFELAASERQVRADQVQLVQVIVNLLTNALDAVVSSSIEDGKVSVRVQRAGGAVVLDVTDNGPGVSPDESERIFDSFYSTKEKGVGVGLAVCRSIIESFHGSIRHLSPAGGGGAVFRVRVPAAGEK